MIITVKMVDENGKTVMEMRGGGGPADKPATVSSSYSPPPSDGVWMSTGQAGASGSGGRWPRISIVYTDGGSIHRSGPVLNDPTKVFAVVGPFESHADKDVLQRALVSLIVKWNRGELND